MRVSHHVQAQSFQLWQVPIFEGTVFSQPATAEKTRHELRGAFLELAFLKASSDPIRKSPGYIHFFTLNCMENWPAPWIRA